MKRTPQIVVFSTGFLVGVAVTSIGLLTWHWGILLLVVGCVCMLSRLKSRGGYLLLLVLGLSIGLGRVTLYRAMQPTATIDKLIGQKVVLTGSVSGEPFWDDDKQHEYYLTDLRQGPQPVAGTLRVRTLVGNAQEGFRMQVTSKVYPSFGKAPAQMLFATTKIISTRQPWYVVAKQTFAHGLDISLGQPAAGFMMGLLVGARSALPTNLQDLLNAVGLSHVVAVSGYNLTILVALAQRAFGKRWRWGTMIGAIIFMVSFVILTGAAASIVRAAVMGTIYLLCVHYGRRLHLLAAVALGALVTVAYQPTYLLNDLGWQLSFLSLTGIVLLAPIFQAILPKRLGLISELVSISLAAQIATAPLLLYNFGFVSAIAPLSNLIVMPLVPVLMLVGVFTGITGIILPSIAFLLGAPVRLTTVWLFDLLQYLSSFKWAKLTAHDMPTSLLFGCYLALGLIIILATRPHQLQTQSEK